MPAEILCIWTNSTAQDLYERYERHIAEVQKDFTGDDVTDELREKAKAMIARMQDEMAKLAREWTQPAALVKR